MAKTPGDRAPLAGASQNGNGIHSRYALVAAAQARRAREDAQRIARESGEMRERLQDLARRTAYQKILLGLAKTAVRPIDRPALLTEVLDGAIALTGANMGNIQLLDPASGVLRIESQREFERFFLEFFASVADGGSACGSALQTGRRIIVEDVAKSPIFAGRPGREIMLDAGAFAVQSSPLIASSGRMVGVLSTHYHRAQRFTGCDWSLLDYVARQTADVLEERNQADISVLKLTRPLRS